MHVSEQLPAYALGCLDAEEAAQVRVHLAHCVACRDELAAFRMVTGRLALGAPDADPPPRVRQRLLQRVSGKVRSTASRREARRWSALPALFPRAALAWGLISLVLIAALAAGNVWFWQRAYPRARTAGDMQVVALAATDAAPGAHGTLVISADGQYGSLVVDGLPQLDSAHQYQVWLVRDGQRQSGGSFSVNAYGYRAVEIAAPEPLSHYSGIEVTAEPVGGGAAPTGGKVLGAKW